MQKNQEKLKERYTEYRIKMKSSKTIESRHLIRDEMSAFLKEISVAFGQDVVTQLTKKR